ncbi:acid protease [Salix suchowensis]|nr:acid protease [Salix suchowensis]
MRLSAATLFALLPFFVAALPHDIRRSIPIAKHSKLSLGGTVNVDALKQHLRYVEGKIRRGNAAYERNTGKRMSVEPIATSRKRASEFASNPLVDFESSLWYGTISVGTPPVEYKIDFDTGSSDLFLPSSDCKKNCDGHTLYDSSKSETSKPLEKDFTLQYGDGSTVNGLQFTDTVTIAGVTAETRLLDRQRSIRRLLIEELPRRRLMGMGYESISRRRFPVFQSFVSQKKVSKPVFAFKLARGIELTLGGLTPSVQGSSENHPRLQSSTKLSQRPKRHPRLVQASIRSMQEHPEISLTFAGKTFPVTKETFSLGAVEEGSEDCVAGVASAEVGSSKFKVQIRHSEYH